MSGQSDHINYIKDNMSTGEILVCIAEEAAELGQAALKLRRAIGEGSPTPVQPAEALADLWEEVADVLNCLDVWGIQVITTHKQTRSIANEKLQRWADRLEEAAEK